MNVNNTLGMENEIKEGLRKIWISRLLRIIPLPVLIRGFFVGIVIYMLGVFISIITGEFDASFFSDHRALLFAVMGITLSLVGVDYVCEYYVNYLKELRLFVKNDEQLQLLIYEAIRYLSNNKYSSIFSLGWVVFIFQRAYAHFPAPIEAFTKVGVSVPEYSVLDLYIFFVYVVVMLLLGFGCYGFFLFFVYARKISYLELVEDIYILKKMTDFSRLALYPSILWFVGVGICAPVLIRAELVGAAVLIAEIIPGFLVFIVPIYYLKKRITITKDLLLRNIYTQFSGIEILSSRRIKVKRIWRRWIAMRYLIKDIEDIKTWPVSSGTILNLLISSTIPYFMQTYLAY